MVLKKFYRRGKARCDGRVKSKAFKFVGNHVRR
jgi:hypothetical protein